MNQKDINQKDIIGLKPNPSQVLGMVKPLLKEKMTKEEFVKTYYSLAEKAGKKYNLNPTVILAQAAHESGWGGSYAARVRKNFFGIIAAGSPNEYWDGSKSPSQTNPHLVFRIYKTAQDSFMDFANYAMIGLLVLDGKWPNE